MTTATVSDVAPGPTRRAEKRQRTHEAILEGAAACFSASWYAGTSVEDVAAAAGVTKPTVYAHFGSKDGLFNALLRSALDELDDMPVDEATTASEVEAALTDYASRRIDLMLAEPTLGVFRAASAEGIRRPEWAQALMASLGTSEFEVWLEEVTAVGLLRVPAPADAAELFWSQIEGALFFPVVVGMIAVPSRRERQRVIGACVRMFLSAHAPDAR